MPRARRRLALVAAAAAAALPLSACGPTGPADPSDAGAPPSSAASSTAATTTPDPISISPDPNAPQSVLDRMTLEQKIGQVLMVGVPAEGVTAAQHAALEDSAVGNVFLKGRSSAGVDATAAVVEELKATVGAVQDGREPFVATDQEGGAVQVLSGPGFTDIPAALEQGTWPAAELRAAAADWGGELAAAGVDVNLAPVADTVPESVGRANDPIGFFGRQYGDTPAEVAESAGAFAAGMREAGVATVPKHFPGLGRVTANTDTSSGVVDTQTTRDDESVEPFRAAVEDGAGWIMVSSAVYDRIDPGVPAPFSRTIVTDMLRQDLGFEGIVISDDLCQAKQVEDVPYAERATRFFAAGGTMLLCVDTAPVGEMAAAMEQAATADPEFARALDEAALRVLEAKP